MAASVHIIERLEAGIGVPVGFFRSLLKQDDESDWSFVIKLHALIEAALTHLLAATSHRPGMEKVYALLDTSDRRTGKLAFIKELGLLDEDHRRFVAVLSGIRNKFVHDVKNVGSTLDAYLATFDSNQTKEFVRAASIGAGDTIELAGKVIPIHQFVRENPRVALWLGAMNLLAEIYVQREFVSLELDRGRVWKALFKSVEGEQPPLALRGLLQISDKS